MGYDDGYNKGRYDSDPFYNPLTKGVLEGAGYDAGRRERERIEQELVRARCGSRQPQQNNSEPVVVPPMHPVGRREPTLDSTRSTISPEEREREARRLAERRERERLEAEEQRAEREAWRQARTLSGMWDRRRDFVPILVGCAALGMLVVASYLRHHT